MPDIAMCKDYGCPLRKKCYRYRAKPNKYEQDYGNFMYTKDDNHCSGFWDISDYTEENLEPLSRVDALDDEWEYASWK